MLTLPRFQIWNDETLIIFIRNFYRPSLIEKHKKTIFVLLRENS